MRNGIAAAGNWIVDRVKTIDHWPEEDTLANIVEETVGNGGGPFNVLADLSRLGFQAPLTGIGLVGEDSEGDWIRARCEQLGIDHSRIRKNADAPTSYTDVMSVRSTGRRTFFHQRGANARFSARHVEFDALDAKLFYLGYGLLLDELDRCDDGNSTGAAKLLEAARQVGMKTAYDVVSEDSGRFSTVVVPTLPHVDYCFMNEFEAERTTGVRFVENGMVQLGQMEETAKQLLALGVRDAVFLHTPSVATAATRDAFYAQPSVNIPDAEVAGSVGAGDAFAAGVLFGLHEDLDHRECLQMGVCAAAASLRHPSASEGVLSMESCLALGAAHGFRVLG